MISTLSTEHFDVAVDVERGAKITSLRDRTGREWLAQAPPGFVPASDSTFTDAEMAGWDECAPTTDACVVDGVQLSGHGDLWNRAFSGTAARSSIVRDALGFDFERSISEVPGGIRLHYRVTALRDPLPFLWTAHPQFSAPAGTRVELGARQIVDVISPAEPAIPFDETLATIDTVRDAGFRKWYAHPDESISTASLIRADGGVLDMEWSSRVPYVAVWFDNRAFSREPVIAIEPSIGYRDALALAIERDRVEIVEPGAPLEWWLDLRLR